MVDELSSMGYPNKDFIIIIIIIFIIITHILWRSLIHDICYVGI